MLASSVERISSISSASAGAAERHSAAQQAAAQQAQQLRGDAGRSTGHLGELRRGVPLAQAGNSQAAQAAAAPGTPTRPQVEAPLHSQRPHPVFLQDMWRTAGAHCWSTQPSHKGYPPTDWRSLLVVGVCSMHSEALCPVAASSLN